MKRRTNLVGLGAFAGLAVVCLAVVVATEPAAPPSENSQRHDNAPTTNTTNTKTAGDLTPAQTELVNKVFGSRLLEIAAEYKRYERVDQTMRWSPTLCFVPPRPPKNQAALSASDSESTHGRKLYYLYARKPWEYRSAIWQVSRRSGGQTTAPWGQVLVKEAWKPVKVDAKEAAKLRQQEKTANSKQGGTAAKAFATDGADTYHAGDKNGLYIMFKTHEDTPGTDKGWVYGTVSADGNKVTSVGRVKNCMQCHQDAPFDRQIGLSAKK